MLSTSEGVLKTLRPGPPVPTYWYTDVRPESVNTSVGMRQFIGSALEGTGLEVGAGSGPFPVPLDCKVLYGDRLPYAELLKDYHSQEGVYELIDPDLVTDLDTLEPFSENSLDFIIACHVIEHSPNPLRALTVAYSRLRPGGRLVLVVPDKERTFDRARPLTTIEHLTEDFESPSRDRDYRHYEEFYRLAFPTPEDQYDKMVSERFQENYAIHYHVWNLESFRKLVTYSLRLAPFTRAWFCPTMPHPELDIEFYCVLTK